MMETTNTLNSGMCRCCSSEGTFKDIKTKYHWMGEEEVYADMLNDCFDIKIHTPEDTDDGICEVCITQLRNAANFKKQVLHTEEQFKKRLQNKEIKNPIKLESVDDPMDSDHLSDPDFSAAEYEVPIKEEMEDKPKGKKRTAKATTSRGKKAKPEAESSKRVVTRVLEIEIGRDLEYTETAVTKMTIPVKRTIKGSKPTELHMHRYNIQVILECSNATPIRFRGDIGYMCCFCSNQYPNPADLKTHTKQDHDTKMKRNFMKGKLLRSYFVKLDITALRCELCKSDFVSLEPLMKHLVDSHGKTLYTEIKNHILPFKFNDEILRCSVCSQTFNAFKALQEHMNIHFKNFTCKVCDSGFVALQMLRTHAKTHELGTFKCNTCPKVFDTLQKQKSHQKQVHSNVKLNRCGYCMEKFRDFRQKIKHLREAHGVQAESPQCKACDKIFNSRGALRDHVKRDHLIERPHKCMHCDMSFFSKSEFNHHLVKHSGVKEFKCGVCLKSYGLKKNLREHMRIHEDDRRFKCEHCDMAFVQKCSLTGHVRSKHSDLGKTKSILS